MELLYALFPVFGWGIQPLLLAKIGGTPPNQMLGTSVGALLIGLLVYLIVPTQRLTTYEYILCILSGIGFVIGQVGTYMSLQLVGVSRTMPLQTALQLIGASLISVLFFGEWSSLIDKGIGFLAILLMIVGVLLTTDSSQRERTGNSNKALWILLLSGTGYWFWSTMPKLVNGSGIDMFLPQMVGIFLGTICYVLGTQKKAFTEKKSVQLMIIGLTFSTSALSYMVGAKLVGVATTFVITQLNVVVATLTGIYILKEEKTKDQKRNTMIGLLLLIAGGILTALI